MDLHPADPGLGGGLVPGGGGDVHLAQPHLNLSRPPISTVETVGGCENISPGYEDSATDITSPSVHQRNHPGKVAILSPPPAQDVQVQGRQTALLRLCGNSGRRRGRCCGKCIFSLGSCDGPRLTPSPEWRVSLTAN